MPPSVKIYLKTTTKKQFLVWKAGSIQCDEQFLVWNRTKVRVYVRACVCLSWRIPSHHPIRQISSIRHPIPRHALLTLIRVLVVGGIDHHKSVGPYWPAFTGHQIELGLKMRVYVICRLAVVSDCTGARVENETRPSRHKQYTHGQRICPSHRTTLPWLHGLCTPCRARCEKQQISHAITWDRILQHSTRSRIIAYILIGLSLPNGLITIDRRRIQPWAWPSGFTYGT